MCFYHSVAIKIEIDDLLEGLGLQKILTSCEGREQDSFVLKSA